MENVLYYMGETWHWLMDNLVYINLLLSIVIVFFQRRDPKAVWTWLLCLYFIPVVGFLFYMVFCQDYRKSKMFRVKEVEDSFNQSVRSQEKIIKAEDLTLLKPMERNFQDMVLYNLETSGAVYTTGNMVEIFTDGEEKFTDLRNEMKRAKRFIHIQYYIIKDDLLFDSLVPIMKQKSEEGVEVRILFDGMGGRFMPDKRWRELKRAGILIGEFFPPIFGRLNLRVNYRNHRKIAVIDGRIGYVGGFNIGKEYISLDPKFGYWRDTHLKIIGQAAMSLNIRFALDWNYAVKENLFLNKKYFEVGADMVRNLLNPRDIDRQIGVQIIASGPDTKTRQIRDNYLRLFHKAMDHIYIQTPYFVPDDAVLSALIIAAQSGVDVRLMIPCMPDHPFVYWATYSYMGDLLEAGARCYTYQNGFLHAKGVTIDGLVSCYGTANMDIRSFELNFEVNAIIFDPETTLELEKRFWADLPRCHEVTLDEYKNRNLKIRIKEQCSRLLSPLL